MKSTKLLASLVTLFFVGGAPLAAESHPVRVWKDVQGREIQARLLEVLPQGQLRIARADGATFTLPVDRLSEADKAYVASVSTRSASTEKAAPVALNSAEAQLRDLAPSDWEMLAAVTTISPRSYVQTPAEDVIAAINNRLAAAPVRLPDGKPLQVRYEGDASAVRVNLEVKYPMNFANFLREVAAKHQLSVKLDASNRLVLMREESKDEIKFLGT